MKRKIKVVIINHDTEERLQLERLLKNDSEASVLGSLFDISKLFSISNRKKIDLIFIETGVLKNTPSNILGEVRGVNEHLEIVLSGPADELHHFKEREEVFEFFQKPYAEKDIRILFEKLKLHKATSEVKLKRAKSQHFCLSHKKIRFDNRNNIMMIDPGQIIFVEADSCYSDIVLLNEKRETLSLTLGEVEKIVPSEIFFRISRTHIINLHYLNIVKRRERVCELIVNEKSLRFKISGNRIKALEKAL